jgi:hypothetical protein
MAEFNRLSPAATIDEVFQDALELAWIAEEADKQGDVANAEFMKNLAIEGLNKINKGEIYQ